MKKLDKINRVLNTNFKRRIKMKQFLLLIGLLFGVSGCGGSAGSQGPAGAPGVSQISKAFHCNGMISGQVAPWNIMNGVIVNYAAYTTNSGDVYVVGNIVNTNSVQVEGTVLYSSTQNGATTGTMTINDDISTTANGGFWSLSANFVNKTVSVSYFDLDVGSGQNTLQLSGCTSIQL